MAKEKGAQRVTLRLKKKYTDVHHLILFKHIGSIKGKRNSGDRFKVLDAIYLSQDNYLTVKDIFKQVEKDDISMVSVYSILDVLIACHLVAEINLGLKSKKMAYIPIHGHKSWSVMICNTCRRAVAASDPLMINLEFDKKEKKEGRRTTHRTSYHYQECITFASSKKCKFNK